MGVQYNEYIMIQFLQTAFDTLFPPHEDVAIVKDISGEVFMEKLILRGKPLPWIVSGFSYRDKDVRALIRANKFYGNKKATRILGEALAEMLISILDDQALATTQKTWLLIPIPSSNERRRRRGYNQVERIVEEALPRLQGAIVYRNDILAREERKSQTHVEKDKRAQNISGAFMIPEKHRANVRDTNCILVDDISESGSTLIDARRALKSAGAREVIGVVIGH